MSESLTGVATELVAPEHRESLEQTVRLASRAQMLGVVHAMAAHDVRDSLNSLTVNVELLARIGDGSMSPERESEVRQRCVTSLRQELKRLARVASQAFEVSTRSGESPERTSLVPLIDEIIAGVRNRAMRQQVRITWVPPSQRIEVLAAQDELRQAVFHLTVNAIDAMPHGGELAFDLKADGDVAVLDISDAGSGMSADLASKSWALFFSTKPKGLGLGLHVVKNVVAGHNGTVTLERRETGVTFRVRLPLVQ